MPSPSHEPRSRILVLGWYGSANVGDEAVLEATVGALRQHGFDDLFILSTDPLATSQRLSVQSHYRRIDGITLSAMRDARALVLGGGGLIQDGTSVYNLPIYALFVAAARVLGLKVICWGLGVEPLWTLLGKLLARFICAAADHFSVRDYVSLGLLKRAGISVERVRVTADPAFLLPVEAKATRTTGRRQPLVVVCIRKLSDNHPGINLHYLLPVSLRQRLGVGWKPPEEKAARFVHALARGIKLCVEEFGARVVLLPLWPGRDDPMLIAVVEATEKLGVPRDRIEIANAGRRPAEVASYIGGADMLVSMRLHALIFAAGQGVPMLALTYARKVNGLMRMLGMRRWVIEVDRRTPSPEEIEMKLRHLWAQRSEVSRRLLQAAHQARRRAEEDADTIAVLLTSDTTR